MRAAGAGIFAVLIGVALGLAPTNVVLACSCATLAGDDQLSNADLAFVGVVTGVQTSARPAVDGFSLVGFRFNIETVQKGSVSDRAVTIQSPTDSASCGVEFQVGERWQVFADANPAAGALVTGLCSGNQLLDKDVPIAPERSPGESASPNDAGVWVVGALGVLVVVAVVAFVLGGRRAGRTSSAS
ncbi:MAG TPA: hypothetical protein VFM74_02865 [Candidatus Limnocylindria bacterium]|nr:hypothetical protein [Candidatus Limnocylindria bacterium]